MCIQISRVIHFFLAVAFCSGLTWNKVVLMFGVVIGAVKILLSCTNYYEYGY